MITLKTLSGNMEDFNLTFDEREIMK